MNPTKTYNLYLDETYANGFYSHFCLAGVIVEEETYTNNVVPALNTLKQTIFNDTSIILHHSEASRANGQFSVLRNRATREAYEDGISDILSLEDVHGLAVAVNKVFSENLYPKIKDPYVIAFQLIIENFVNFLERNNAIGNVILESRTVSENKSLIRRFNGFKHNGTLFYTHTVLREHLGTINFNLKIDNIAGLQIADILPIMINRELDQQHCKHPKILSAIQQAMCHSELDNTQNELTARFGLKIVP